MWPSILLPGIISATTNSITIGPVQVGIVGFPLMTKYGLFLLCRMASAPSKRKPQIL